MNEEEKKYYLKLENIQDEIYELKERIEELRKKEGLYLSILDEMYLDSESLKERIESKIKQEIINELIEKHIRLAGNKYLGDVELTDKQLDNDYENIYTIEAAAEDEYAQMVEAGEINFKENR